MHTRVELAIWIARDDDLVTDGDIDRLCATADAYLAPIGGIPEIHAHLGEAVLCLTISARDSGKSHVRSESLDRQYVRSSITRALAEADMIDEQDDELAG
jgi:hypothetical protein